MKRYILAFVLGVILLTPIAFAAEEDFGPEEDELVAASEEIIIPEDINWTERFILSEIKELRSNDETLKREVLREVYDREIEAVDKALSYSANTVNYFFIILTLTIMAMGVFGWRSIREVKQSLHQTFEQEVQKSLGAFQKKLRELEKEQEKRKEEMEQKQQDIEKKQAMGEAWSRYNREEDSRERLKILDEILALGENEDKVQIERSNVYLELELPQQVLELCNKELERFPENTSLLYNKAAALMMLEKHEEMLTVLDHLFTFAPHMREELLEDELFAPVREQIAKHLEEE